MKFGYASALISRLGVQKTFARQQSSALQKVDQLLPGSKLHGYTVEKIQRVPELCLTAVKLNHDKTGAQHLHVARDDSNNVFGVSFRTTPMDDTGVPHILEHTVLCGSQKFPVRDPFFKMLNRSLSTFMNAFTSTDWTMYPFSTQNAADYHNLMSVYLDAVFFPRLRETDFNQEGWRLEHEQPRDQSTPIMFKGVVFNEMKGVFSDSQQLFNQKTQNFLLPSHTYATCFGGDPAHIPSLTWEQLKQFHASHYHPSNSRFYTYGDFPLEKHLEQINEEALSKFGRIDPKTEVPLETRWVAPREERIVCQPDPMCADPNKQTTVAVSYLLNDVTDPQEQFVLSFLGGLLVSGEKSPFYRNLIEPNIGSDFAPVHGYDCNSRDAKFSVGLQGINEDDVERVKHIIETTIDEAIRDGFEEAEIEAKLHEVELALKHQTTSFGLHLGINVTPVWNHDADPMEFLQVNKYLDHLKDNLKKNPKFLQHKVQQYFKDNLHRLTLVMSPSADFESKRQEQEATQLKSMVDTLSEADKKVIYEKGLELESVQNQQEDLSCLPTVHVSDIGRDIIRVPVEKINSGGVSIQTCVQPTNGVTYFRGVSSISELPADLRPYVPLFCDVITSMGAGEMDYRELAQQASLKTGGLNVDTHVCEHHTDPNLFEQSIVFSSYCLDRNLESMFHLWNEVFQRADISDEQRMTTLIRMAAADLANGITMSGHMYAIRHAASSLSPTASTNELFNGMTQVTLMKSIAEMTDLSEIISKLKTISAHVLNASRMRCAINTTGDSMDTAVKQLQGFVSGLPQSDAKKGDRYDNFLEKDIQFEPQSLQTHYELPFQVNYVAKSIKIVPYSHEDFPRLTLLAKLMSARFLHREIREKGGAYGGGAMASGGHFNFFSYRDPNSVKTLEAFDRAVQWAQDGSFTAEELDEAKLGVFQKVDMPTSPGQNGMRTFLHDISDELRHEFRMRLINAQKEELIQVAKSYLTKDSRPASLTMLGPENPLTNSEESESWNVLKTERA